MVVPKTFCYRGVQVVESKSAVGVMDWNTHPRDGVATYLLDIRSPSRAHKNGSRLRIDG